MDGFKLLPAGPEDEEEWAKIYYENGKSSPLHALQNENVRAEDDMEYRRQYTRIKLNNPNPDIECLKLVDESNGKMVAFVQWGFIDEAWDIEIAARKAQPFTPVPGKKTELGNEFYRNLVAMCDKNEPKERRYHLMEIGTHPDYQRRGIGEFLVKYGTDRADRDAVLCCCSASPMGAKLYRRLGWDWIDSFQTDLEAFGGKGSYVQGYMIRQPRVRQ